MREQLIGYLLGALEADEQAAVEQQLRSDQQLRDELEVVRKLLEPLQLDPGHSTSDLTENEPPIDLVSKTLNYVDSQAEHLQQPDPIAPSAWNSEHELASGRSGRHWSLVDLSVAASVFLAASVLFLPALSQSRAGARLLGCENNLQRIHNSLAHYAEANEGFFPKVPATGKLAVAGIYAPILTEGSFLTEPASVICPDSQQAEYRDLVIPGVQQVNQSSGTTLVRLYRTMGGSYAYPLGFVDARGIHRAIRNQQRHNFALMADAPGTGNDSGANHGGMGQNVLCEDGSVRFLKHPYLVPGHDHIYLNDANQVDAGLHQDDSVLASSWVHPHVQTISFKIISK